MDSSVGLGFLLQRAHNRIREAVIAALDGSGVHPGHLAILGALASQPGLTQRELCTATGIEKSSMVLFLDRLEADGWVERRRHPKDRRAHVVLLTKSGIKRLAALHPRLKSAEEGVLAALSAAQRRQLATLLNRIASDT